MCYFITDTDKCFYFGQIRQGIKMVKETKKDVKKSNKKVVTKKKQATKKTEKKQKVGFFKKISNWIKSIFKEVSKVKWPSKKEMIKYSVTTIVFVLFFALFFYAIELVMAFLKSLVQDGELNG